MNNQIKKEGVVNSVVKIYNALLPPPPSPTPTAPSPLFPYTLQYVTLFVNRREK